MKTIIIFILFSSFIFSGCELMKELVNMDPPEIKSYSPNAITINSERINNIRISFSSKMEKAKTEEAFSLTENDETIFGTFVWQGNTMIFTPYNGFKENSTYEIQITTASEDTYGNSLSDEFSHIFYTGTEKIPPLLEDFTPENDEEITDFLLPITLLFSEEINIESFYSSFSINPEITFSFTFTTDSFGRTEVTAQPNSSYEAGEEYRVEINTSLKDNSGNNLPETCFFYFTAEDTVDQGIDTFQTQADGTDIFDITITSYNNGIEKDEIFVINFLAPVEQDELSGIISIEPNVLNNITWSADYTSCTLEFTDYLSYDSIYEISLLEDKYRIRINGDDSIPPTLTQSEIIYYDSFGVNSSPPYSDATYLELDPAIDLIINNAVAGIIYLDFYIEHAPFFDINLNSFIDALSITNTNQCIALSIIAITRNPAGFPAPNPPPAPNVTVMRITCNINTDNPTGTITFSLDTKLKDTNDNNMQEAYTKIINKTIN